MSLMRPAKFPAFSQARAASLSTFFLLASTLLSIAPVQAQELIDPQPTRRKFPATLFCPMQINVTFVADGPSCTVQFSTDDVHYFSTSLGAETWSQIMLDNICVTPEATFQAHNGALDPGDSDCYVGDPVTDAFYFHEAGPIPLLDKFDTDPAVSGWDLLHGAYWQLTRSGTNNPGDPSPDYTGRSLGLGLESAPDDSAWTSIIVTGLSKGQTYRVTGWWNVQDFNFAENQITLWVGVLGNASTPLARKSWGAVRRRWN